MTTATTPIGISRLGQIAINANDLDRATAFYRDILGLPLLFTTSSLTFFDCGGVRLMLSRGGKAGVRPSELNSVLCRVRHRQRTQADAH
jgi:catechol 2,3-dioxygenase-like lactoylglutathione lyase family enzyme